MRHQNRIKKLGRTAAHRKATLAALSSALIEHKRIETTLPKAKALRSYVEPLINRAKEDTTSNRRQVFRRLQSKEAVKELFGDIAASVGDRPGGYTRVIKLGLRQGDGAEMAVIELVDYNDVQPEGGTSGRKRTRRGGSGSGRRRRSGGGTATTGATASQGAASGDNLTKVFGVGKAFASALNEAGITTYQQLADADLASLRKAISLGSDASDAIANEETWAEQAALLAAGDKEGHDAYVDRLRAGDEGAAPAESSDASADAPETPEAGDPSGSAGSSADAPEAEAPAAEAPAAEDASTQSDDAPETPSDMQTEHPDTPQGAAPQTGDPAPETGKGDQGTSGGSQHRG